MLRRPLLWASRNRWLAGALPKRRFVQRAVQRFMPGETREAAIQAGVGLGHLGIGSVYTLLGENVTNDAEVAETVAEYRAVLDVLAEQNQDAEISVKLTQLGLDQGQGKAEESLRALAAKAEEVGSFVWVDMEDTSYREATLRIVENAGTDSRHVGVCLQAYLRSTPDDIQRLRSLGVPIRMVKGAYNEPRTLAFPDRARVDEAFYQSVVEILETGGRAAVATHDEELVKRIRARISERRIPPDRYEFQMLFGIRRELQTRLAEEGEPIRVLISYGPAWFPWYMRRLAERPANVWFVLKSLFRD